MPASVSLLDITIHSQWQVRLLPLSFQVLLEHVGYWTLFPLAAVLMALAFCTMLLVKHGDHKPRLPQDKLEMLDVGD